MLHLKTNNQSLSNKNVMRFKNTAGHASGHPKRESDRASLRWQGACSQGTQSVWHHTLLLTYLLRESTSVFAVFTARLIMGRRIHTISPTIKTISYVKTSVQYGSNETLFNNIGAVEVPEL